jgi:hypothetical protein
MDSNIAQDVFHTTYRDLTEEEVQQLTLIKQTAALLYSQISQIAYMHTEINVVREVQIAQERLEEAIMWAGKAMSSQLYNLKHN